MRGWPLCLENNEIISHASQIITNRTMGMGWQAAIFLNETAYALKTPHTVFLPVLFLSFFFRRFKDKAGTQESIKCPRGHFLTSWPLTLTFKLDQHFLPLDLHAKIQVRTPVCLAVKVVTHTDRHTDDVKTITTDTSEMWGVIRKEKWKKDGIKYLYTWFDPFSLVWW